MKLAILSPEYPPNINALGDYGILIGRELQKNNQEIIWISPVDNNDSYDPPFYGVKKTEDSLLKVLKNNSCHNILLNYSGYGYQSKGLPFWLLKSLRIIKSAGIKIHIIFHELYASTSSISSLLFFTSRLQKYIYTNIACLANSVFCTNEVMLNIMENEIPNLKDHIIYLPLCSNIPTPNEYITISKRGKSGIVFGTLGRRNAVYNNYTYLNKLNKLNIIDDLIDIGNGVPNMDRLDVSINILGNIADTEVSVYMLQARIGFIDYRNDLLAKSGIFAAYAGNGLAIINTNKKTYSSYDKIVQNQTYSPPLDNLTIDHLDLLSLNAFNWYKDRRIDTSSKILLRMIQQNQLD